MGNNGSSARDQQSASSFFRSSGRLAVVEMGHSGWSQSLPRELARHRDRAQPSAVRKVLPTGAVQRLRATDNGTIIHSGGTISGRRPPTSSSSRDLVKRNESTSRFRERIGSASNVAAAERRPSRRFDRHWCRYRADPSSRPESRAGICLGLKRSGSEPDLRSSPDYVRSAMLDRTSPIEHRGEEPRTLASSHHRHHGRESKDRLESRYRARKKYKAPAPPGPLPLDEAMVHRPETSNEQSLPAHEHRHQHPKIEPPPRRSRLFKTRVESKKALVGWQPSAVDPSTSPRSRLLTNEPSAERETANVKEDPRHCAKSADHGKNTLQRSMSSPEFRAELIRVAKRVRDKLEFRGRTAAATGGEPSSSIDDTGREHRLAVSDVRDAFSVESPTTGGPKESPCDGSGEPPFTVRRRRSLGNDNDRIENSEPLENRRHQSFASTTPRTTPKTFYFGMNNGPSSELPRYETRYPGNDVRVRNRDRPLLDTSDDTDDNDGNVVENISLNIRPTLPKKQLEIPRFSPSAAWRLLSAIEAPGPSMSTASEEMPLMFEERIERLSRPPPLFPLSLGTRSWQDKSGDSGISGDAGAANEDSVDVGTINRVKPSMTRPTWTPQQDLGEESSSDAGVDSPPPLPVSFNKYHPRRPHVFSLSLPRDDTRGYLNGQDSKPRVGSAFNSLQKLKRSVSGAFGIGTHDHRKQSVHELIDDNWLLSCSAPTSLQPNQITVESIGPISPSGWTPFSAMPNPGDLSSRQSRGNAHGSGVIEVNLSEYEDRVGDGDEDGQHEHKGTPTKGYRSRDSNGLAKDFPVVMKPPSFSYLAPAGHPMYLPEVNQPSGHRMQNFAGRSVVRPVNTNCQSSSTVRSSGKPIGYFIDVSPFGSNGYDYDYDREAAQIGEDEIQAQNEQLEEEQEKEEEEEVEEEDEEEEEEEEKTMAAGAANEEAKRCVEQAILMGKRETEEDDNDRKVENENEDIDVDENRTVDNEAIRRRARVAKTCRIVGSGSNVRNVGRSITDQANRNSWSCSDWPTVTTVITKETKSQRRNASKSKRFTFQSTIRQIERRRLAERLSREAEAKERQRKGELEAMRKVEEEFQRKRAKEKANIRQQLRLFKEMEENFDRLPTLDWDGGSQMSRAEPDGAASSTASSPISMPSGKKEAVRLGTESKERHVEQKFYRPRYYDWSPDTGCHSDCRQTTVHPKVVCDIPKSSAVFVDANVHSGKPVTSGSTPRSDNYRKDFAHGTLAAKTCFANSESEFSQPNTRPHSRQNGPKGNSHRSRSASPGCDKRGDALSSEEDAPPTALPTTHQRPRNPIHDLLLSGVQPYTKRKAYRPISFNPSQPSTPIPS